MHGDIWEIKEMIFQAHVSIYIPASQNIETASMTLSDPPLN
jgi:hypothetical protein